MMEPLAQHSLSVLIFLPLLGAILVSLLPAGKDAKASKAATLLFSLVTLAWSLLVASRFNQDPRAFRLIEDAEWLPQFGVRYSVGVDGISLALVLLTTVTSMLAAIYSMSIGKRVKEYMVFLLVLEAAMLGVFCALDLVLFYVFWEAVLIPMYFLIGMWGHERRIYAAIKFFLYTFAGSILMLLAIVVLRRETGTFNIVDLGHPAAVPHMKLTMLPARELLFLFSAFALAFMIKVPMFPFHTWLPDAHVEAPTAGSVILAGVLLKMGVYGFLRICLPFFPAQAQAAAPLFITLAVIGIVYGGIVAAVQPDMKKLVAYSSVSHMGFVMLGVFSFTALGVTGAILQSINHGISTGMLFFLVGMMYDRKHTRDIAAYGGIKRSVPVLAAFFLIAMLSSVALPLTNGFVGEFTILLGSYGSRFAGPVYTAVAATGMVLSAVYMLWLFQRVFAGPIVHDENKALADLDAREKLVLSPLVLAVFALGLWVTPWTNLLREPVETLLKNSSSANQVTAQAGPSSAVRQEVR